MLKRIKELGRPFRLEMLTLEYKHLQKLHKKIEKKMSKVIKATK